MKRFKRRACALCGRKATMKFIREQLKKAPHRKAWICMIHCSHCGKQGTSESGSRAEVEREAGAKSFGYGKVSEKDFLRRR